MTEPRIIAMKTRMKLDELLSLGAEYIPQNELVYRWRFNQIIIYEPIGNGEWQETKRWDVKKVK